jgi:hypothetical protein
MTVGALSGGAAAHATSPKPQAVVAPPYAAYRDEAHKQLAGTDADCFAYARRAFDLMRAKKIPVRIVVVAASDNDFDTHTFVEVRRPGGRWAVQDPTFQGWWSVDGRAASAADLQNALLGRRLGAVRWHGAAAAITRYYVNPLLLFRTVRYESLAPNGNLVVDSTRTVPLSETYYGVRHANGSVAQVMVIHGGADWHVGGYALKGEPNGDWVSPIGFLAGLRVTGVGNGAVRVLSVPRLPLSLVASASHR